MHLPKFVTTRKDLFLSILVALVVIGLGLFLGWDNNRTVISYPHPGFHYMLERHNPLSFFSSWDSPDYLSIAKSGYSTLFWANWFPLYPMLISAVNHVIPSALDSALLIAWASLVGAIYFYIKIVRRIFKVTDDLEPLRALIFFVLFPTGVFLIAPFTESLYALLALGAIYCALEKQWVLAAALGLLCTATHVTGMAVVVLVALILLEEKIALREVITTFIIGSLGLVGYMAFLLDRYNNPLAFLESQQVYHGWTHSGVLNLVTSAHPFNVINIILLALAVRYWWNRRRSFSIYTLLFFGILLAGKQYGGFNRYVLMAFPVQFMLYGYFRDKKAIYPYITALLGIAWTYFLLQYAGGYIGS